MKYLLSYFFITFILLKANCLESKFNYLDLKTSEKIELNNSKETTISSNNGIIIQLTNSEFRGFFELEKNSFKNIQNINSINNFFNLFAPPQWGSNFKITNKKTDIILKVGTLSFSNSISNLKNPSPSTNISPFTKQISFNTGFGSKLPYLTSSEQPLGTTLQFKFKESAFSQFELLYTNDNIIAISANSKLIKNKYHSMEQTFTCCLTELKNNTAYLKKHNLTFSPIKSFAGIYELAIKTPNLKSNFFISFHQSPYGNINISTESKTRIIFNFFLFDFLYFTIPSINYSPEAVPLMGINSSICKTIHQLAFNPQFILPFDNFNLQFGFNFIETKKIVGYSHIDKIDILKIRNGLLIKSDFFSIRGIFSVVNIPLSELPKEKSYMPKKYYDLALTTTFIQQKLNLDFNTDIKYYPTTTTNKKEETKVNSSISMILGKQKKLSLSTKGEISFKNNEKNNSSLETSVNYKIKGKKLNSSIKCTIVLSL